MRLAGANSCVVAKKHGWKWKPSAGPYHMDLEYTMDLECILGPRPCSGPCHSTDATSTENK